MFNGSIQAQARRRDAARYGAIIENLYEALAATIQSHQEDCIKLACLQANEDILYKALERAYDALKDGATVTDIQESKEELSGILARKAVQELAELLRQARQWFCLEVERKIEDALRRHEESLR